MQHKAELMDEAAVERALVRISHQIIEKNHGTERLCLVGIRTRGVPLARRIAENIRKIDGTAVPVGGYHALPGRPFAHSTRSASQRHKRPFLRAGSNRCACR